jgi:hypothetical protein
MSSRAAAASRARGSLVLGIFGSLWLAGAVSLYANGAPAPAAAVAAIALLALGAALFVLVVAWRTAARLKQWSEPWPASIARGFWIVNIAQYAAIGLVVSPFANGALQASAVPLAIAIVGLHFLPLARLFNSPPHAWIGLAMLTLAGTIALLHLPPFSPVSIFAGGVVLLGGALLLARIAMREGRPAV